MGVTVFVFVPNRHGSGIEVQCRRTRLKTKNKKTIMSESILTPIQGDNDAPIGAVNEGRAEVELENSRACKRHSPIRVLNGVYSADLPREF